VLATAIVIGIALTEREGILPHVAIPEFEMSGTLYQNGTYITGVVFFFGTAILTLSELVTRIAQRLRQREERIRQLYEARSTFLRVATHELRAPLGAGLSLMHNIQQGYAGEFTPEQGDILDRVTRRLEGLRTLIDDLLTLAASQEVTAAHVPLEPVGVCPILDRIVEREMPNAERKNIQLTCDKSTDAGVVMAGDVGLGIILGNLLNNAIKYTPEGGRVNVKYRLNRPAQRIEITVSDSGIGIPADDMPRLFDEFFRARNTKTLQVTGTGIGLSTVRTLLDRYHGHITIESEEGKGTTVHVTLPLALRYTLSDG
jgi:signal transduction histidine kinase